MVNEDFSDIHMWPLTEAELKSKDKARYQVKTGKIFISRLIFEDFGDITDGISLVGAICHEVMHKILDRIIGDSGWAYHQICWKYDIDRGYQNGTESVAELA